jgi:hypothetical protein
MWASGLSYSITETVFRSPQCVSCDPIKEGNACARENEGITKANAWIELHFSLIEHPLRVLYRKERKTQRQRLRMYKIQWSHHIEEEATWETEEYLNTKYPGFLQYQNREFLLPILFFLNRILGLPFKGGRL